MDIRRKFKGSGYLITGTPEGADTTNIVCAHGHIYADGKNLVAALDGYDPAIASADAVTEHQKHARALRKLGEPVMDGDDGELSVRFPVSKFSDVARILKPRQAELAAA